MTDSYCGEFFATLADGGGVSVPSNGAARDAVVAGTQGAVGVLDYMAREARIGGADIDFAYPASGTVLIPSPVAMTASAANPDAAQAVVDFLLSRPGQKIMVQIGNFYPVRSDVPQPAGAPPLSSIQPMEVDWTTLGAEVDSIRTFWESLYGASAGAG